MYLADYHTHTRFSPDAAASMTALAEAGIAAGLGELCFTDHVEPVVWGGTALRTEPYDWAALAADFRQAQADWGGRITLRLGMELGDAVWSPAHTEALLRGAPDFDFIIGSVHMLPAELGGEDLFLFNPADEDEARLGLAAYLRQVRQTALLGGFSVLGHLTLPLRYLNEFRGFSLTFDGFEAEIAEILRILIAGGRGIELNVNRGHTPLPDEKWLRLYRTLGGTVITLGTDAHMPSDVGRAIAEGQALLRTCGFTRFCTFARLQPVWHLL